MTAPEAQPSPREDAYLDELRWVHGMLRRDLQVVRDLAAAVADGAGGAEVAERVRQLATGSTLWQLRVRCLHHCAFVHAHHGAEDRMLFPVLREIEPGIGSVIDKLEADHRTVATHLDRVEAAAGRLTDDEGAEARGAVLTGLTGLADLLLVHLAYEETELAPALRTLARQSSLDGWER